MNTYVRSVVLLMLLGAQIALSPVFAGSLDRLGEVDAIRISPSNGQATIVLVLEERILNREVARKLHKKLNEYQQYARSEQFFKHHPRASADLPVILLVMVPTPVSTAEMQNLTGIKNQFGRHGVKVAVEQFEPPRNAANGASGT
jgi:hypothetical protein